MMDLPINQLFHSGFYAEAASKLEEHRKQQIANGFMEYGQTYNPHNFTPEEQMNHFMSEIPDILHYGYGMFVTMMNQQETIARMQERYDELEAKYEEAKHRLDSLEK
jgi:hypothetical protein